MTTWCYRIINKPETNFLPFCWERWTWLKFHRTINKMENEVCLLLFEQRRHVLFDSAHKSLTHTFPFIQHEWFEEVATCDSERLKKYRIVSHILRWWQCLPWNTQEVLPFAHHWGMDLKWIVPSVSILWSHVLQMTDSSNRHCHVAWY